VLSVLSVVKGLVSISTTEDTEHTEGGIGLGWVEFRHSSQCSQCSLW